MHLDPGIDALDREGGAEAADGLDRRNARALAQVDVLVFALDRPVRQEHPLDTATRGVAGTAVVADIGRREAERVGHHETVADAGVSKAARCVDEDRSAEAEAAGSAITAVTATESAERDTDAAACRAEIVDALGGCDR